MNGRNLVVSSLLMVSAAVAVYVERGRLLRHVPIAPVVTVEKIEEPHDDNRMEKVRQMSAALRTVIGRPLMPPPAEESPPAPAPNAQTPALSADVLVAKLQHEATMTDQETASVTRVFKIAADIQPAIDAEASDDDRATYQEQLITSIELRLKLILKDDRRLDLARSELRGFPRIVSGT